MFTANCPKRGIRCHRRKPTVGHAFSLISATDRGILTMIMCLSSGFCITIYTTICKPCFIYLYTFIDKRSSTIECFGSKLTLGV